METDKQLDLEKAVDEENEIKKDNPPVSFSVKANSKLTEKYSQQNLPDWSNNTNCGLKRIRIVDSTRLKRQVVLHEMMHEASNCSQDPELHWFITAMAPKLEKLMQENPKLTLWLTTPNK